MFCSSQCHDMSHSPSWSSQGSTEVDGLPAGDACDNPGLSALAHSCALLAVSQARASVTGSSILVLQPVCSPEVMQALGMMYGHCRLPADDLLSIRQSTAVSDHLNASLHTDGVSGSASSHYRRRRFASALCRPVASRLLFCQGPEPR